MAEREPARTWADVERSTNEEFRVFRRGLNRLFFTPSQLVASMEAYVAELRAAAKDAARDK